MSAPAELTANKALCHRLHDLFRTGDVSAGDQLHPNFVWHTPSLSEHTGSDVAGFRRFAAMLRAAFSDLNFVLAETVAEDDRVALAWRFDGTHDGDLGPYRASNKPIMVTGISIVRIRAGHITDLWHHWGEMGMLQQMEVMPFLL